MGLAAGHQTLAGDIPAHIPDDVRGFVRAFGVPQTLKDYAEIVSRQRVDLNCMTAAQKYILKNHIVIFKSIRAGTMPPPDAWNAFVAAAPHDVATDSPSRLAPQSAIGEDETVAQTLQHKQVKPEDGHWYKAARRDLQLNHDSQPKEAWVRQLDLKEPLCLYTVLDLGISAYADIGADDSNNNGVA
eukprot:gene7518-8952_t